MSPSSAPPEIYDIHVKQPSNWNKSDWSPLPDTRRIVPMTGSICLDFASPSTFLELPSRPALILAPARTWHVAVGAAMWEQAKARAEELGSYVLWCDGGAGGLSGVAGPGMGMREPMQVGQGAWARRVGVPWPFDTRRTAFMVAGREGALAAAWGVLVLGWAVEMVFAGRMGVREISGPLTRVSGWVRRLRRQVKPDEERPLLQ